MPIANVHVLGSHQALEAQKSLDGPGATKDPLPLHVSASSNTDPVNPDVTPPQRVKSNKEPRVCLSAPAGQYEGGEVDTRFGGLPEKLLGGLHISQRAQGSVTRRQMDHVRALSLCRQGLGELVQGTVGPGLVLAFWIAVDLGTEQTSKKHVPRPVVFRLHPLYTVLEL
jgi:hypothetical protein